MGRGSRKEAAEPRITSEDWGWGGGLGRGGKGAAGEGDAQRGEKIGQRPQLLSDFRFQFQREKVGTKGVSLRLQEVRTLREGLGRGVSGLRDLRAPQARVCPADPRTRFSRDSCLEDAGEAGGLVGHRGPRLVESCKPLTSLPFKGGSGDVGRSGSLVSSAWFR